MGKNSKKVHPSRPPREKVSKNITKEKFKGNTQRPTKKETDLVKPPKGKPIFSIVQEDDDHPQIQPLDQEDQQQYYQQDGAEGQYEGAEGQYEGAEGQYEGAGEQYEGGEDIDEQIEEPNQQEGVDQQEGAVKIKEEDEPQEEVDDGPVDISVMSLQIQETIAILMNVTKLGRGLSRKHYIDQLKQLAHKYYDYNMELIEHFLNFLNPTEMIQLMESNETQRPLTIRTNTLKTRRKELAQNLIQRGVNLDPLAEWSKVGIKIYESKVPIGATPQYLAGHYMLQSASSFLPVLALDPQSNDRILDMAAAPGGKTTYIAQLMKNTGCVFANDLKKERLKALQFNLYRLGVTNTAVTCKDGRKYPEIFPNSFDRVLLDAPCTGLGIISKDPSIKATRLLIDIYKNSHVQKELILAAIDCTKVNGVIVYSTCSISPLQNQDVVNFALKKRFVKVVDTGVEVGEEGLIKFADKRYHVDLKKTRRIYPHVHNMDGFYVAKLVKVGKGKRDIEGLNQEPEK